MLGDTLKTKRRTEITIETDDVLVLRHSIRVSQYWCSRCSEQVRLVTADQAAVEAGVSSRTIYRWIEAGKLHFIETPGGLLLVCLNSIHYSGEAVGLQANSTKAKSGGN